MNVRTSILSFACSALILATAGALPRHAIGDEFDPPHQNAQHERQRSPKGALVDVVRQATGRFRDVSVAEAEGYRLHFGCVSSPDEGAMGLHYVNMALVGDGVLDPAHPEIVIYEPLPNGRVRLIGTDYLTLSDAWHAGNQATPDLMGQLMHLIPSPNRYGLPAFYTLHVWAWKANRHGTFVNWHPDVSCEAFDGRSH
jgi:hypothetical protein